MGSVVACNRPRRWLCAGIVWNARKRVYYLLLKRGVGSLRCDGNFCLAQGLLLLLQLNFGSNCLELIVIVVSRLWRNPWRLVVHLLVPYCLFLIARLFLFPILIFADTISLDQCSQIHYKRCWSSPIRIQKCCFERSCFFEHEKNPLDRPQGARSN